MTTEIANSMRIITATFVAVVLGWNSLGVKAGPSGTEGTESLGDQLLNDLSPSVIPLPTTRPADGNNKRQAAPNSDAVPATPRFDDLGDDIAQPSGPMSLVRVRQTMQQATAYLTESENAVRPHAVQQAGAAQEQVVAQLDKLIAELSKQCQGGQCQGGNQPKSEQPSQSKPGSKPGNTAGKGRTAARDSTDRLDRASAQPIDKGEINELVKDLWGHLPERSREQMLQSYSDEFLPKYEFEIEQYYRRLSEEKGDNRP
jgi:hypothetical protein